jgi:dynein heavy chain
MNPLLPVIQLVPAVDLDDNGSRYNCPMYITGSRAEFISMTRHRNNYVISVLLPTDFPDNYWILKGTALITQITN